MTRKSNLQRYFAGVFAVIVVGCGWCCEARANAVNGECGICEWFKITVSWEFEITSQLTCGAILRKFSETLQVFKLKSSSSRNWNAPKYHDK
jgi:hypothetical protein